MNIIISIYVYNFHVIISYLGGGIRIVPFKDNRNRFFHSNAEYFSEIPSPDSLTEMQAKGHILYGTEQSKLIRLNLATPTTVIHSSADIKQIPLSDISQLALNYTNNDLFAMSDNNGIFQIDISKPRNPEISRKILPKAFDKLGHPAISNLESTGNNLLVAIRNYGVSNIVIDDKQQYKEGKELLSEDPQDVKRLAYNNLIVVADSQEGVILYNFDDSKKVKTIKLPDSDFPQQIETTNAAIIIKGAIGLYAYYPSHDKLVIIRQGKVGTLATYYDYVFFTSKGKLFLISLNNSFDKHQFSVDANKIDLEILRGGINYR